jgi:hypothetical protein
MRSMRATRGFSAANCPLLTRGFHAMTLINMSRAICAGSSR